MATKGKGIKDFLSLNKKALFARPSLFQVIISKGQDKKDILTVNCFQATVPGPVSYTHLTLPTILRV